MHLIAISNKDMKLELKRRHKTDIGLSFIEEEEEKVEVVYYYSRGLHC